MVRNLITGAKPRTSKWKIAVGGLYSYVLWSSVGRCYVVFYEPVMQHFESNYAGVSQLSALAFIGSAIVAMITPTLLKCFGYRKTVMSLSFFGALSVFVGSFMNNLTLLTLCVGFIPGLCLPPCFHIYIFLASKFSDKTANYLSQLMCLGGAIGPFATCPLFQVLIDSYGWRGALQIMSGLMLNMMVGGATLLSDILPDKKVTEAETCDMEICEFKASVDKPTGLDRKRSVSQWGYRKLSQASSFLNLRLLASLSFWTLSFSHAAYFTTYFAITSYIIPFATKGVGLSEISAATLICGISVGDGISKILHGLFYSRIPRRWRFIEVAASNILLALFLVVTAFASSYVSLMLLCVLVGLIGGGILGDYIVMIRDVFPIEIYHYVTGYLCTVGYLIMSSGQVLTGFAIDQTESLAVALYIGGVLTGCAAILQLPLFIRSRSKNKLDTKIAESM